MAADVAAGSGAAAGGMGTGAGTGSASSGGGATTGASGAGTGSASSGAAGPLTEGSQAAADWRSSLSPDLAAHPSIKTYKSPADLAKSHVELQKLQGASIRVPGTDASREDWDRVWNKLGRPETVQGYKVTVPKLAEGKPAMSPQLVEAFTGAAHASGLSNWQAQQLINWWSNRVASQVPDANPAAKLDAKRTETELRGRWQGAYDRNIELAKRGLAYLGGEPLAKALNETGAANHPDIVVAFAKIGSILAEDSVIPGDGVAGIETAKAKHDAIMSNPKHAYWNRNDPGHKQAVEEILRLAQHIHDKP